ncbi:MAG: HD domain-containing protein [Schaedlerella sp.]|nr:HD domain-containing protein [Schaedlerella sp.]
MSKEEKVIKYYVLCNQLKNIVRTGWMDWHVQRSRIESVAEHIYGVQMLAIAMKSEFKYEIDMMKVIYMLAIHELGETVIGDLTRFQISKEEKTKLEHEAVHKILEDLLDAKQIEALFLEFDAQETEEAKFAYQCDKLECDLQCKLYDEEGCVDLNCQEDNLTAKDTQVKELLKTGASWSEMWLRFGQQSYPYDENFRAVSEFAMDNKIQKNN